MSKSTITTLSQQQLSQGTGGSIIQVPVLNPVTLPDPVFIPVDKKDIPVLVNPRVTPMV